MLRPPSHSSFPGANFQPQFDENVIVEPFVWKGNYVEAPDNSAYSPIDEWAAGPSNLQRRNTNVIEQIKNFVPRLELHEEEEPDFFDEDVRQFINPSLLSNLAVQLHDNVPRGTHVKGSVPYPRAFTGKDVVVCMFSTWFILFFDQSRQ